MKSDSMLPPNVEWVVTHGVPWGKPRHELQTPTATFRMAEEYAVRDVEGTTWESSVLLTFNDQDEVMEIRVLP